MFPSAHSGDSLGKSGQSVESGLRGRSLLRNIARILPKRAISVLLLGSGFFGRCVRKLFTPGYYQHFQSKGPETTYTIRIPVVRLHGHGQRVDSDSRIGNRACNGSTPMITPIHPCARSLDEAGAGIPHAGISEERRGETGGPTLMVKKEKQS